MRGPVAVEGQIAALAVTSAKVACIATVCAGAKTEDLVVRLSLFPATRITAAAEERSSSHGQTCS